MIHYQQPNPYGCTYYSFASLVQDDWFLQFADELGSHRLWIRAWRRGYMFIPVYSVEAYICKPAPEHVWRGLLNDLKPNQSWHLHISCKSLRYYGVLHHVGIVMLKDAIFVTDPGQPEIIQYTFEEFLRSPYAISCYEIMAVYSNTIKSFPLIKPEDELTPLKEPINPLQCKNEMMEKKNK